LVAGVRLRRCGAAIIYLALALAFPLNGWRGRCLEGRCGVQFSAKARR